MPMNGIHEVEDSRDTRGAPARKAKGREAVRLYNYTYHTHAVVSPESYRAHGTTHIRSSPAATQRPHTTMHD